MKTNNKIKAFLLISLILPGSLALALTKGVRNLVDYETKANAAGERSREMIPLQHVEIPIDMVGLDFASRLDAKIAASLVITKNGQKYARWILNPEDTKWNYELLEYFMKKGLDLKVHNYFHGYQTASRSYIAEDPNSGAQFSVKSSTNTTGGAWRDKKQPVGEAIDGRILSDFFMEQNAKLPFKNFTIMDEPAVLKLAEIDQAVVIRDLGGLKDVKSKFTYVPGFSVLHENVGREIALKNGSKDPYAFWTQHYVRVAGRALGELAARTGVQFDSPHSQNFLVELDSHLRPTGRLVLRDMSDLYLDRTYLKALQGEDSPVLKAFTQQENKKGYISAGFGPLHGNEKPTWVSEQKYSAWKDIFFKEFENTFEKTSGFNLAATKVVPYQSSDYYGAQYKLSEFADYNNLYGMMRADGVVTNKGGAAPACARVLSSN